MVSNVIWIPFFDTEHGYGSLLLELFKLHPWALGVSCDAFREMGKRSACLVILSSALWPALFMPYVHPIPHFRASELCPLTLCATSFSLDSWLYVPLQQYPFVPAHISKPKECKKLFVVQMPEKSAYPFSTSPDPNERTINANCPFIFKKKKKKNQQRSLLFLKTWNCLLSLCSSFTTMQRGMDHSCLRSLIYYRGRLSFLVSFVFPWSLYWLFFSFFALICIWFWCPCLLTFIQCCFHTTCTAYTLSTCFFLPYSNTQIQLYLSMNSCETYLYNTWLEHVIFFSKLHGLVREIFHYLY